MRRSGNPSQSRRRGNNGQADAPSGPQTDAIIIFAKAPVPAEVKTRMCPPLTPDEAASLHGSLVMDTVERTRSLRGFDRFLACLPGKDHPFFQTLAARHRLHLHDQAGANLGQRMNHALTTVLNRGYSSAVLVGTDVPDLSAQTYTHAQKALQSHDVVFGPTKDGGYYLVGIKKPAPELFATIPWSTDHVLTQSRTQAQRLGLTVALLDMKRDIDTMDDLHACVRETAEAGRRNLSIRTANVFHALIQRHRIVDC